MIYFVTAREIGRVKIGFSDEPRGRFIKMRTDSPVPLVLERICDGERADEAALHSLFQADRLSGEWFNLSGVIEAHMGTLPPASAPIKKQSVAGLIVEATGCSKAYASQMLSDKYVHVITVPIAISVYRHAGQRIGPLIDATDAEIDVLEKYCGRFAKRGAA